MKKSCLNINVYIDESGSIHKNSKTLFFAVGGYFVFNDKKDKVVSFYKKINRDIKISKNILLTKEMKSYDYSISEKINIIEKIQDIDSFCAVSMVFLKEKMNKQIIESNIFFNYAVRLLFQETIIPIVKKKDVVINFIVSVDNRNIRVGDLNNLENYLNTEFCNDEYYFKVTYYDSKYNYGIQLADLMVNSFYNYFKNFDYIKNVFVKFKKKNYRICVFPFHKIVGKRKKINYIYK